MGSGGEMSLASTCLLSAPHRHSGHNAEDPERLLVLAGVMASPAQPSLLLLLVSSAAVALRALLAPRPLLAGCQHPPGLEGETVLGDDPSSTPVFLHFYSLQYLPSLSLHGKTQSS